jgi:hypothetical protein
MTLSAPITGAVARVQVSNSDPEKDRHKRFTDAVHPDTVMLPFQNARALVKRGVTAEEYFPASTDVIVTTTVKDRVLNWIPWKSQRDRETYPDNHALGELDIVREFEPDYYIPADYSAYNEDPPETRRELQKECMAGTLWMKKKIEKHDLDTELIPIFKGVTPESRELCYELWDRMDAGVAAYYCTRYFTAGKGRNQAVLLDDLETVAGETDIPLLCIGLLSPNLLERSSPNVVAGSGLIVGGQHRWRDSIAPTKHSPEEMRDRYGSVVEQVEEALGVATPEPDAGTQSPASVSETQ